MVNDSVVVDLPEKSYENLFLMPREKPLPKKKEMTKWEAFAQTKGYEVKIKTFVSNNLIEIYCVQVPKLNHVSRH